MKDLLTISVLIISSLSHLEEALAFSPSFQQKNKPSTLLYSAVEEEAPKTTTSLPDYGKTSIEVDKHRLTKIKKWRRRDLDGQTLIEDTLAEMKTDETFIDTQKRIEKIGIEGITKEERLQRRRALNDLGVPSFQRHFHDMTQSSTTTPTPLMRKEPKVLQINIGLYCNQACAHCHVESSPLRISEQMTPITAARCVHVLCNTPSIHTLDITGGAPELCSSFRTLVLTARSLCRPDLTIIDRCNLSVLHEPGQEDLVDFLKENRVRIVASLPCYGPENVDKQRGSGVFERSISALLKLNEAGYGVEGSGLEMDLVYNPLGAFLPPEQGALEEKYKEVLDDDFGIVFNHLFTMTNMPIKRFADFLAKRGELKDYMDLLVRNFNVEATKNLMCLDTVSIGYDGKIFDCDFNQQLGYNLGGTAVHAKDGMTVHDVESYTDLMAQAIRNDNHCFGCTAGMGSS